MSTPAVPSSPALAWTSAGGTWASSTPTPSSQHRWRPVTDEKQSFDDLSIKLRSDLIHEMCRPRTSDAIDRICLPDVDERAGGPHFRAVSAHRTGSIYRPSGADETAPRPIARAGVMSERASAHQATQSRLSNLKLTKEASQPRITVSLGI